MPDGKIANRLPDLYGKVLSCSFDGARTFVACERAVLQVTYDPVADERRLEPLALTGAPVLDTWPPFEGERGRLGPWLGAVSEILQKQLEGAGMPRDTVVSIEIRQRRPEL